MFATHVPKAKSLELAVCPADGRIEVPELASGDEADAVSDIPKGVSVLCTAAVSRSPVIRSDDATATS